MADPVAVATAPGKIAAKGVKGLSSKVTGRKPIVYVLMAVGVAAIAYYLRQKRLSTEDTSNVETTGETPLRDISDDYPSPTQGAASGGYSDPGAYGGYPTPDYQGFLDSLGDLFSTAADSAGSAAAASAHVPDPTQVPSVPDTGGGVHLLPPSPGHRRRRSPRHYPRLTRIPLHPVPHRAAAILPRKMLITLRGLRRTMRPTLA